jgi:HD-like signal output (HDOD) protein
MQEFDKQAEAFAARIEKELEQGQLNFPTALDVTMRIKRLADNPNSTMEQIAAVVRAEPVLSTKVLRMANSVLLNPYGIKLVGIQEAVTRIGLSALRSMAFAVAAEQLIKDNRSRQMRVIASGLWMHSVDVAAWAYAISRHLRVGHPETAMLVGMMVDIGQFYLISRAGDYPALENDMPRFAEFISTWKEPVGRAVLEALEVPEAILDAFQYEELYGGAWPPENLSDVVFIAGLATETPNPFDSLLGHDSRSALWEACSETMDAEELKALIEEARSGRQELLSAVMG